MDSWKISYNEEDELIETHSGVFEVEETKTKKYLKFIISNDAKNVVNIESKRGKSISTTRSIMHMVKDLQSNAFECCLTYLHSIYEEQHYMQVRRTII